MIGLFTEKERAHEMWRGLNQLSMLILRGPMERHLGVSEEE